MSVKKTPEERTNKVLDSFKYLKLDPVLKSEKSLEATSRISNQEKLFRFNAIINDPRHVGDPITSRDIEAYLGLNRNGGYMKRLTTSVQKENAIKQPIQYINDEENIHDDQEDIHEDDENINNTILEKIENNQTILERVLEIVQEIKELKLDDEASNGKPIRPTFLEGLYFRENFLRGYRLNTKVAVLFAQFCNYHQLSHQDSLSQALFEFVKKYESETFSNSDFYQDYYEKPNEKLLEDLNKIVE